MLDNDLLLEIKRLAQTQGTTSTNVIHEALAEYVAERRSGRSRRLSFTSVGKSGRRTVSKNAETILRKKVDRREGW
jgi:hypothetical protein